MRQRGSPYLARRAGPPREGWVTFVAALGTETAIASSPDPIRLAPDARGLIPRAAGRRSDRSRRGQARRGRGVHRRPRAARAVGPLEPAVSTWRDALRVLVPLALHAIAREIDAALGLLLHTSLDLERFVPQALRLVDVPALAATVAAWCAAGAAIVGRAGPGQRRRGVAASLGAAVPPAPASARDHGPRPDLAGHRPRLPVRLHAPGRAVAGLGHRPGHRGRGGDRWPRLPWQLASRPRRGRSRSGSSPLSPTRCSRRRGPIDGKRTPATSRRPCAWRWPSATG